jgi:hypothetical protein
VIVSPKAKSIKRNRKLDAAAKLARRHCECGAETCHRPVTANTVGLFEWDHLVQSFDDPNYIKVSALVGTAASAKWCDRERAKCRLLYFKCHQAHSVNQLHQRRALLSGNRVN